jgi:ADP-heptose:LPS heptosyltransferase
MATPVKFLILRFDTLGDVVMTSPVVRCLKKQVHHAEIHYLTSRNCEPAVAENPYIDACFYLDANPAKLVSHLRTQRYDYIIDLQNNAKSALLKLLIATKSVSCDSIRWQIRLMTRWKINVLPNVHIVDRFMATVARFGVKNDGNGLDYFIPYKDQVEADWLPKTHRTDYVALVIGTSRATHRLPTNRLIELCRKINYPIVLLGHKTDAPIGDCVELAVGKQLIYNACGKYNQNQLASLVAGSRIVFSHDADLMHVAAAFKKKVYSIWGSSTPLFGRYPYKTPFLVLENNSAFCRPCSSGGKDVCPLGHFNCLNDLSFDFRVKELNREWR